LCFSDTVNFIVFVAKISDAIWDSVADPDPESGAFLIPDPVWVKNQDPDPG
jgi:hypothetical protein